jgi:hypothetical protein
MGYIGQAQIPAGRLMGWQPTASSREAPYRTGVGGTGRFWQSAARPVQGVVRKDASRVETRFEVVERWETHRGRRSMAGKASGQGGSSAVGH